MEFDTLPFIDIEWNELIFLSPGDGLGIHFYKGEDLEASASIGYDGGREEGDDRKNLNGLGDVADSPVVKDKNQFSGGMFLSHRF